LPKVYGYIKIIPFGVTIDSTNGPTYLSSTVYIIFAILDFFPSLL